MIYGHIAGSARYGSGSLPAQSSGRTDLPLMRLGEDPNGCKPALKGVKINVLGIIQNRLYRICARYKHLCRTLHQTQTA